MLVDLTSAQDDTAASALSTRRRHRHEHEELVDLTNSQPDDLAGRTAAATLVERTRKRRRHEPDGWLEQQWQREQLGRVRQREQAAQVPQRQSQQAQPVDLLQDDSPQQKRRRQAVAPHPASPPRQVQRRQEAQQAQQEQQVQQEQQPCSICFESVPEMMHGFGGCAHGCLLAAPLCVCLCLRISV